MFPEAHKKMMLHLRELLAFGVETSQLHMLLLRGAPFISFSLSLCCPIKNNSHPHICSPNIKTINLILEEVYCRHFRTVPLLHMQPSNTSMSVNESIWRQVSFFIFNQTASSCFLSQAFRVLQALLGCHLFLQGWLLSKVHQVPVEVQDLREVQVI